MRRYAALFKQFRIGEISLANRLAFISTATHLANTDGTVSNGLIQFLRRCALSGAGLIITECAMVNTNQHRRPSGWKPDIRINDDAYISGLQSLASAIHASGARIFIQLGFSELDAKLLKSSDRISDVSQPLNGLSFIPLPASLSEFKLLTTSADIISAAVRISHTGADGIELDCSSDTLIGRLLSPKSNRRTDQYGGSIENRFRFLRDIITRIRRAIPGKLVISCRFSLDPTANDKRLFDEIEDTICQTEDFVRIDAIHVVLKKINENGSATPITDIMNRSNALGTNSCQLSDNPLKDIANDETRVFTLPGFRDKMTLPLIVSCANSSLTDADSLIACGAADICGFDSPLPDETTIRWNRLNAFKTPLNSVPSSTRQHPLRPLSPAEISAQSHSQNGTGNI